MVETDSKPVRSYRRRIVFACLAGILLLIGVYGASAYRQFQFDTWKRSFVQRGGTLSRVNNLDYDYTFQGLLLSLFEGPIPRRVSAIKGQLEDSEWAEVAKLQELDMVEVYNTPLTPKAIEAFRSLPRLRTIYLPQSQTTDETLELLCEALKGRDMKWIVLGPTTITEDGILKLKRLKNLNKFEATSPHVYSVGASFRQLKRYPLQIPLDTSRGADSGNADPK